MNPITQDLLVVPFTIISPLLFPTSMKKDVSAKSNIDHVPQVVKFYSKFSQKCYTYRIRTDLYYGSDLWQYRADLSTKYVAIWVRGKRVAFAIRGTGIRDPLDLSVKWSMYVKNIGERVRIAKRMLRFLLKTYDNIIFVGHSMGGAIVMETIRTIDPKFLKKITPVALDPALLRSFMKKQYWKDKKLYIYRTAGDPVSVHARLIKATRNVTYKPKMPLLPAHMIEQLM